MSQIVVNIFVLSFVYILIAKSFIVIHGTLRFFHLAHAISLTLGAYLVYTAVLFMGAPFWMAVSFSIAIVVLLMLALNKWIYKPLQERETANWLMMIASLGLYLLLQNAVSMVWGDSALSFRTWETKVGRKFFGAYITELQIIMILSSIILLLGSWLVLEKTIIGRQICSVSSNAELSRIMGISRNKAVIWSVVLGTGLSACAGVLIAADTDMTPTMGFDWLMYGVVVMIIGGMGKMRYIILGAFLLAAAQQLSAYFFGSKWMNATAYIILVIFLYFRPFGFSGKQLKKTEV